MEPIMWCAEWTSGSSRTRTITMTATLKPKTSFIADGRRFGIAEHKDGDHVCHVPYSSVKEGENIAGRQGIAIVKEDGSYEMLTPGAKPCSGPAQVATEQYRRGWEEAFGRRKDAVN